MKQILWNISQEFRSFLSSPNSVISRLEATCFSLQGYIVLTIYTTIFQCKIFIWAEEFWILIYLVSKSEDYSHCACLDSFVVCLDNLKSSTYCNVRPCTWYGSLVTKYSIFFLAHHSSLGNKSFCMFIHWRCLTVVESVCSIIYAVMESSGLSSDLLWSSWPLLSIRLVFRHFR